MGDPSQDAAPAACRPGAALKARYLQVFQANATLALHPCQTAAAHLPCTRPPDCWVLLGRPRARSRPEGHRDCAARVFVTTRSGFDKMARRRQDANDDELMEADDTAGAATFGGAPTRGPRPNAPAIAS